MPRRRGEYTLAKSTSFTTTLPFTNFSNKSFYSVKNETDQGTYKTKIFLNATIAPLSNCSTIINDTCATKGRQQQLSLATSNDSYHLRHSSKRGKKMTMNSGQELPPLFSPNNHDAFADGKFEYAKSKRHRCRTISNDSSFRNSLKYSFEKIKLRATSVKRAKSETEGKSIDELISLMSQIPSVTSMVKPARNHLAENGSWKKLRKVRRSRSDAFVNSQEWTLCRGVAELKLGLVGSLHSGKTSLVHRYLTGAYTNEESPEGGRFKKEVVLDGQSYLLLIRDEGSAPPDYQFAQWIDAVIVVFSLESQESIETALHYYEQMAKYRNVNEIPVMMVATQDAVTESSPRVISEREGRQMAKNLPKCSAYYETCSTYGLNVDRVFKDG
ncbi:unnamed protein product [Litomosoides sigmodontis]|uniref:Uncharacterized protein n=1 Tax=Litomosoides sigmodontis TaxID=42156 RepID=A0A3P6TUD8_LITSI|nr:unnamed protein product [Litomosoides sigmodontis]